MPAGIRTHDHSSAQEDLSTYLFRISKNPFRASKLFRRPAAASLRRPVQLVRKFWAATFSQPIQSSLRSGESTTPPMMEPAATATTTFKQGKSAPARLFNRSICLNLIELLIG